MTILYSFNILSLLTLTQSSLKMTYFHFNDLKKQKWLDDWLVMSLKKNNNNKDCPNLCELSLEKDFQSSPSVGNHVKFQLIG